MSSNDKTTRKGIPEDDRKTREYIGSCFNGLWRTISRWTLESCSNRNPEVEKLNTTACKKDKLMGIFTTHGIPRRLERGQWTTVQLWRIFGIRYGTWNITLLNCNEQGYTPRKTTRTKTYLRILMKETNNIRRKLKNMMRTETLRNIHFK